MRWLVVGSLVGTGWQQGMWTATLLAGVMAMWARRNSARKDGKCDTKVDRERVGGGREVGVTKGWQRGGERRVAEKVARVAREIGKVAGRQWVAREGGQRAVQGCVWWRQQGDRVRHSEG